jgi:hypothetical protein
MHREAMNGSPFRDGARKVMDVIGRYR